jgi:hypothetical protein
MKSMLVAAWALAAPVLALAQSQVKPPPLPPGSAMVRVEPGLSAPERQREVRAHHHKFHHKKDYTRDDTVHGELGVHDHPATAAPATAAARSAPAAAAAAMGAAGQAPCGQELARGCELNATFRPEPQRPGARAPAARTTSKQALKPTGSAR